LSAIDRLDDAAKTTMLARAFSALIRAEIGYDQLQLLVYAIDRCLVVDLDNLSSFQTDNDPAVDSAPMLSAAGLLNLKNVPQIRACGVVNEYELTKSGDLFLRLVNQTDERAA